MTTHEEQVPPSYHMCPLSTDSEVSSSPCEMTTYKECDVEGCGRRHRTRGYCATHYNRLWRTGDVHPPVPFKNYPNNREPWVIGGLAYVPLTQKQVAIIDVVDLEKVRKLKWHANKRGKVYRISSTRKTGNKVMARIIMEDQLSGSLQVDHINGDPLDNRRCNLRICTPHQNKMNSKKRTGNYKGVSRARNKWVSSIGYNGNHFFLGHFDSEEDAAIAYDVAAQLFFGNFASLNFSLNT